MKKNSATGMAALVALGVSVGVTAEVGAKEHLENAKVKKEVSAKQLKSTKQLKTREQVRQAPDLQLDDARKAEKIKMDGPPRP